MKIPQDLSKIESLIELVRIIRTPPEGCIWVQRHNHQTLSKYAIEEVYEVQEAIEKNNPQELSEELGDLLFQVILHAQIGVENKTFSMEDVIRSISEKIIRRHPHVFAGVKVQSVQDIKDNWDKIKQEEKKKNGTALKNDSYFSIPNSLPALQAADKIGMTTQNYKFDWTHSKQVLEHLESEIAELKEAIKNQNQTEIQDEIGDVAFTLSQLARHLNIDAENATHHANRKFIKRFNKMLELLNSNLEKFKTLTSDEKLQLWEKAKKLTL